MAKVPGHEAGATAKGEIVLDLENLREISCCAHGDFDSSQLKRREVSDYGDECFLLHSLLTSEECQHFISEGEREGFGEIRGAKDNYRSMERMTFSSPELASLLWERVEPHLSDIVIQGDPCQYHIHGIGFLLQGRWVPYGVNQVFRLCRYKPGGHFAPHFDGHFVQSANERSLKTLMVYLNGDFTGGSTNFISEKQTLYTDEAGKYCAEEDNILCRVQPEAGLGILFNHHRLHEGQKLGEGRKYILRTDVMFRNVEQAVPPETAQRALLLLQEAEEKEGSGESMEAMELYRKAFKLCPELEECT